MPLNCTNSCVRSQLTTKRLQVQIVELDEDRGKIVLKAQVDHPYPTTKIMWMPETVRTIICRKCSNRRFGSVLSAMNQNFSIV